MVELKKSRPFASVKCTLS